MYERFAIAYAIVVLAGSVVLASGMMAGSRNSEFAQGAGFIIAAAGFVGMWKSMTRGLQHAERAVASTIAQHRSESRSPEPGAAH